MDYEQKYKEALERAKGVIEQNPLMEYQKKGIEYIFPELKESEDERIRTFLHHTFTAQYLCKDKLGKWHGEPVANILAWLEKQCEVPVTINIDKMVMDYTNECGNDGFGKPLNCMIRAYRQGLTDAICTLTLANKKNY